MPNLRDSCEDTARKAIKNSCIGRALQIASREGLAALTIGRLAEELRMSKSGLFAHFRSKETLELATVERAREIFDRRVLLPAESSHGGLETLWNLCDLWLEHLEERVFPGDYFFAGAFLVCAQQGGPIPKRIVEVMEEWIRALKRAVRQAQNQGRIDPDADPGWTAFELNGLLLGAYWARLMGNWGALGEGRATIVRKFHRLATEAIPSEAFDSVGAFRKYLKTKRT